MLNKVAMCYDQETSTAGLKSVISKQLLFPFDLGLLATGFTVTKSSSHKQENSPENQGPDH